MYTQKSFVLKPAEADKKWYLIDGNGLTVGRLATKLAMMLLGKHKPCYTPNTDSGDFIIVTNCEKVKFTGKKLDNKIYNWHTNHIGGIKSRTARVQLEKHPERVLMEAVKGMLPKNSLGRQVLTKLKVVQGDKHPHEAQKPEVLTLGKTK